eukprot:CAMPEP_0178536462 /NCGR_PEP_ID=MMETSP0696-20121128/36089_1 /TAXON_ID=265572 /ORGANISM="Extubocellulus spinifer, Strain CCMP396" /LENGTH=1157 /DNA_ID=CAMNT_0020168665 /DNA_START=245 /DNA_END=3718 /DNA_ORIENTATION=+
MEPIPSDQASEGGGGGSSTANNRPRSFKEQLLSGDLGRSGESSVDATSAFSVTDVPPGVSALSSGGGEEAHSRSSSYSSTVGPLMAQAGYGRSSAQHQQNQQQQQNPPSDGRQSPYVAPLSVRSNSGGNNNFQSSVASIDRTNSEDTSKTLHSWPYERAIAAQNAYYETRFHGDDGHPHKGGGGPASPSMHKKNKTRISHFMPWRKNNESLLDGVEQKLGTISGVFLPCLSQILGIIFYLRLPTITAQAGCIGASAIIAVCVLSTFVTSLSLSAIATNGTIQAGGPYYIISRTLGIEVGGSLGLLFYLGNTIGAAMYVLGAVEAFQTNLDYYGAPAEEAAVEEVDDLVAYYEIDDDDVAEEEEYVDPNEVEDDEDDWFGSTEIASMVTMFILAIMVGIGMKYVNYTSGMFLSINLLSIISILLGAVLFGASVWDGSLTSSERVFFDNVWPHFGPDPKTGITPTFASLLALFYPSVTGIMAGTNRSGKLAKPSKSIPKGTISAITVTSLLYFVQVWLVGSVVSHKTLMENKLILACLAWPSRFVIKAGIITASIGAAMQCLAGAPQLLAAIAVDDAIPMLRFVRPSERDDPKTAIFVTYIIASMATLVGNLDHITPIITMFFLLMYGGINLCCFLLGWVNAPGFRPTFRFYHKNVSLFGSIVCLLLAFTISWFMAVISIGLFIINYIYIRKMRQRMDLALGELDSYEGMGSMNRVNNWGDVGDSLRYKITMMVLMSVQGTENFHAKNWRPQLLTIIDTDDTGIPYNTELLALAAQLKKGRGLNMVLSIKRGSLMKPGAYDAMMATRQVLKRYMYREGLQGFASIAVTHQDFSDAVIAAVTHAGIGPISPNIVMMPFLKDWKSRKSRAEQVIKTIQGITIMKRAVVLFKGSASYPRKGDKIESGLIDIYWVVEEGGLCLLIPYLLSQHRLWRKEVTLRIFAVATDPNEDLDRLETAVIDYCESVRIEAIVNVIDMARSTIATDMTNWHHGSDASTGAGAENPYQHRMTISKALTHDLEGATPRASSHKHSNFESPVSRSASPQLPGSPKKGSPESKTNFSGAGDLEISGSMVENLQRPAMGHGVVEMTGEDAQIQTAKIFNNVIRFYSHSSNLVVTNMPLIESMSSTQAFFAYIDRLSMCVDNIMLVRGSEYDVVTTVG